MSLTKAQQRVLDDLRRNGPQVYNGLMGRTVKALAEAGLVVYEFDLKPSCGSWTEQWKTRLAVRS